METYDVECQVSFGGPVADSARAAFRLAAQGQHPGWHGPRPVVSWRSPLEVSVFLVLKGPAPQEASAEETVCQEAEAQVSGWLEDAGIVAEPASGDMSLRAVATARIA